jgi:hypothetical protein
MRNLLAFLAMVLLTVAGVGWYLGWYQVHTVTQSPGHRTVKIDIDTNKVGDDLKRGEQKIEQFGEKYRQRGTAKEHADASGESEN